MFDNTNNNSNAVSINTNLLTWFGSISALSVGAWNDKISIKISPLVNVTDDGLKNYDFKKRINTALGQEKISALVFKVKSVIIPALEEGKKEKISEGVEVGRDNSGVFFEYDKLEDDTDFRMYLVLRKNIAEDKSCLPENEFRYKFENVEVMEGYDSKGYGDVNIVESEFLTLIRILDASIGLLGLEAHSIKWKDAVSAAFAGRYMGGSQQNTSYDSSDTASTTVDDMPF